MRFELQYSHEVYADFDKVDNKGAKLAAKDQDVEMLDQDEDIAIAKVIQASLDDAKMEKTKTHLKALQKAMGVAPKKLETSATADKDIDLEDDGFMVPDESDGDGENDVVMAEGGYNGGDEV